MTMTTKLSGPSESCSQTCERKGGGGGEEAAEEAAPAAAEKAMH